MKLFTPCMTGIAIIIFRFIFDTFQLWWLLTTIFKMWFLHLFLRVKWALFAKYTLWSPVSPVIEILILDSCDRGRGATAMRQVKKPISGESSLQVTRGGKKPTFLNWNSLVQRAWGVVKERLPQGSEGCRHAPESWSLYIAFLPHIRSFWGCKTKSI